MAAFQPAGHVVYGPRGAAKLKVPKEKFYLNIHKYGNTSSASIPIALDELNRAGKLHRGDLLLLPAFGGGLASACCLVRW